MAALLASSVALPTLGVTHDAQAQPAPPPPPAAAPPPPPAAEPPPGAAPAAEPSAEGAEPAPDQGPPDTWGHTDREPLSDAEATPAGTASTDAASGVEAGAARGAPPAPRTHPDARTSADGDLPLDGGTHRAGDGHVRYSLQAIEVRGNTRTHARVILRYLPFEPGDLIDVADPAVELTRYRLLGTGFFSDVQFSLRRGTERGQVVLVIDVVERNTIIVNGVWLGLSADRDEEGHKRPLTSFGGIDVAETNLAGTGITLGSAVGVAQDQLGLRLRFLDPALASSSLLVSAELLYNDAQDFFGNSRVTYQTAGPSEPLDFAVLPYKRFGGSVGVGWDLSVASQAWLHYRLEAIDAEVPVAAAHSRGGWQSTEPIDFDVEPGDSVLSAVRATLGHDTRDQPFLPQRGYLARLSGEFAITPLGSDYAYQKIEVQASRWWRLPWHHVVRLELFGGAITGYAPFFEQYYVGDFSDFLASRALALNFDRRAPPNYLGTAIAEVRRGHFSAKLGGEYRIPLYRGHHSVYGIDAFASSGIYAIASQHDLDDPPADYAGMARIPVDLTGNLGLRLDTSAGGLTFSFSNVLGFTPLGR